MITAVDPNSPNPPVNVPMSEDIGTVGFSWYNAGTSGVNGFLNGGTKLKKSVGVKVRLERNHDIGTPDLHEMATPVSPNESPDYMKVALIPISYIGYKEARCIIEIPITQVGDLINNLQRAQATYMSKKVEWELDRAISRADSKTTIPVGTPLRAYM